MNTSPAPDVDRVLNRIGRSAFGYRSFANPVNELAPLERIADDPAVAPAPEAAPGSFSLVSEALPAAAPIFPPPVFPPPIQPPPEPVGASAPGPRITPLSHAFAILSGHAEGASGQRPFGGHETAFPFRRR